MDPFTQRILEKAEQRSKALGISKSTSFPLCENEKKVDYASRKLPIMECADSITPSQSCPSKITRHYSVDKENMDVGIEINITTGSNVQVQVEVEEQEINENTTEEGSDDSKQSVAKIRDSSRNRLQRLGVLYSNNDLSSPIHRTEGKFHEEDNREPSSPKRIKQKFGKLAALADSIKCWEDDTSHPDYKHPKLKEKQTSASPIKKQSVVDEGKRNIVSEEVHVKNEKLAASNPGKSGTKLKWDKNVLDSLEAQGFQRRQSMNTKFSYEYKNNSKPKNKETENKTDEKVRIEERETSMDEQKSRPVKTGLVLGRAAEIESKITSSPGKAQKDPAELTLKERMMLFEKNKGRALLPKAAFAMPAPANKSHGDPRKNEDIHKKAKGEVFKGTEVNVRDKVAALTAGSATISEANIKADILKQRREDMEVLANRFNKQKDHHTSSGIVGKESNTSAPPPPPPMPPRSFGNNKCEELKSSGTNKRRSPGLAYHGSDSSEPIEVNKRLKANSPRKSGRLYPNLSDLEPDVIDNYTTATISTSSLEEKQKSEEYDESYMDSEDSDSAGISNVSLGREIMRVVQANESRNGIKTKEIKGSESNTDTYCGDSSVNSYVTSDGSVGIDDYLDEALDEDEESEAEESQSNVTRHSQGTTSSNSFSYQKRLRKYSGAYAIPEETDDYECYPNMLKSSVTSPSSVNTQNDPNVVTLVHTVSFYRRQQATNSNNSTPVRTIHREEQQVLDKKTETEYDSSDDGPDEEEHMLVQEKIKKLLDEVCKQQQVIAQTSQALNLCASTIEFSGSTESVEGERHLLVATHRRQAALDEVQRLRVEGRLLPNNGSNEKGRLTVKEITVPLKQDYIRKLSADTISGHHLVCLLKYNEIVLATKTVPTLPGLLAVKFPDVLQLDVHEDFRAVLEIYGMTAQREVLPHEVKYHINLNKKAGIKTPKKKGSESRLIMPIVQSPAGPHVVRTPALVQYGFAIFSLREVQRTTWTLTEASRVSPLEGSIHMKINCELTISNEYKGFLTMFEEISGFGAWHRRWCYLTGNFINYWKYPDDEKKKAPMGTIDLNSCCNPKITTAPRDLCARLNTLLLECQRSFRKGDVQSHLIIPKGNITIVRYLLSADTREERDEWAAHINKTVSFLRAWGKGKQRE